MELYKTVILCTLAVILLTDVITPSPVRSHNSRHLRSNHLRIEQDAERAALFLLDAEADLISRNHRNRNANRRRRSFPNGGVNSIMRCIRLLRRARTNPNPYLSTRCQQILRPGHGNHRTESGATVVIIDK